MCAVLVESGFEPLLAEVQPATCHLPCAASTHSTHRKTACTCLTGAPLASAALARWAKGTPLHSARLHRHWCRRRRWRFSLYSRPGQRTRFLAIEPSAAHAGLSPAQLPDFFGIGWVGAPAALALEAELCRRCAC